VCFGFGIFLEIFVRESSIANFKISKMSLKEVFKPIAPEKNHKLTNIPVNNLILVPVSLTETDL